MEVAFFICLHIKILLFDFTTSLNISFKKNCAERFWAVPKRRGGLWVRALRSNLFLRRPTKKGFPLQSLLQALDSINFVAALFKLNDKIIRLNNLLV